MSTFSDGRPSSPPAASGAPSLIGAGAHPPGPDAGTRVLAHLEGRKPPSSTAKLLGGGVIAAVVLGAGGLGAWQLSREGGHAPAAVASAHPAGAAASGASRPADPESQQVALADRAPAQPQSQPARIIQDEPAAPAASPQQQAAPGSPLASLDAAAAAATAPLAAALPTVGNSAPSAAAPAGDAPASAAAKPQPPAAKPVRVASATKKPVTRDRPANRTVQARKPAADPDADLLAALLQRRDPRPVAQK